MVRPNLLLLLFFSSLCLIHRYTVAQQNTESESCVCVHNTQCNDGILQLRNSVCDNMADVCCHNIIYPQRNCSRDVPQSGHYPWMMLLLNRKFLKFHSYNVEDKKNAFIGGGSLIHPQVVLTAAHKVEGLPPYQIRTYGGVLRLDLIRISPYHQYREVEKIEIHPGFNKYRLVNDVALLFLSEPMNINSIIDPICLPASNENFDDSRCYVSGWGKSLNENVSITLKGLELPFLKHERCQGILRRRFGGWYELDPSINCAGGEVGKDACTGDGGSPLVCPLKSYPGRYAQAGIVAEGIECGSELPGFYASVPHARSWIEKKLAENGF